MKVTKNMVHVDLKAHYSKCSVLPLFLNKKWSVKLINAISEKGKGKNIDDLDCSEIYIPSKDNQSKIRVRVYRPLDHNEKLPCMLYLHGGGYIMSIPEEAGDVIKNFIETRPCVVIAPDYRRAFTQPYPAAFNDCYDTLLWAKANAEQLGILDDKFIVAGHSAGGGLTAAVTLKARDTKDVNIAFQMPFYPMIDDSQPCDPQRYIKTPIWDTTMNKLGWDSYLADFHKNGDEIPAYAAPARNSDYTDFPPTITFVGNMEPFYWETVAYVDSLRKANINVLFKEYKGCFHAFDMVLKEPKVSKDAREFTYNSFAAYYDKYIV
jgi:acetyl esterase/lipase